MNRLWGHTLSVVGLTLAAGSAAPACAHDDASFFVQGVLAPPTPSGGTCVYTPDPTATEINRGLVDGALRDNYTPVFLVGSTLVPQGNTATPASETARIEIQGALVQVVDPTDNSTWENNTILTAAEVEPAAGSSPSYTAVSANIMDAKAVAHFASLVTAASPTRLALAYVTFYGQTLGGQSIQSNQYQFPVDVCSGCLVEVPAGEKSGYCQGDIALASSTAACAVGQDQTTDCQLCYPAAACNLTP